MKSIIGLILTLLLIFNAHTLSFGQNINSPYVLPLFSDVLPVLHDSTQAAIGINYKLNDYKGFDGNVVQLGLRTRPFYGKRNLLSKLETGVLINGYFHQKFYWVNACCGGSIIDHATGGYDVILYLNQKFKIGELEVNVAAAPRINLVYSNVLQFHNGQYYFDNSYLDPEDRFGWVASLAVRYKNLESWASFQHNVIGQHYIDWGSPVWENSPNYLLDPSKTYFYKLVLNWTGYTLYNLKYGAAWKLELLGNPLRIYSFATYRQIGSGLIYSINRFSFNPEYTVLPAALARSYDITGHQIAAMFSYKLGGFEPHYSLQLAKSVWRTSPITSTIGLQYKF